MKTYWIELVIGIFLAWYWRDEIDATARMLWVKVQLKICEWRIKYYVWRIHKNDEIIKKLEGR